LPDRPLLHRYEPPAGWLRINWRELWEYRELLFFLAWRDVALRYKQTALGVIWVILQPLLSTVIFTIIFGQLLRVDSNGIPYAAFALSGLVPWTFFNSAISRGASSLVGSSNLLSKVYFPRLLIPAASVMGGSVDLLVGLGVLAVVQAATKARLTLAVLALPASLAALVAVSLGMALLLAALNVQYRDVERAIPFLAQVWFYLTPIIYPVSIVPEQYRWLFALNPMTAVIEGFRVALFGQASLPASIIVTSGGMAVLILGCGLLVLRKMEITFADVV
jgi:lipopolysaccharide transport system permease protein